MHFFCRKENAEILGAQSRAPRTTFVKIGLAQCLCVSVVGFVVRLRDFASGKGAAGSAFAGLCLAN
jgi:hypothetical protein